PTEFFDVLVDAIDGRTIRAALEERLNPDAESPLQEQWAEVLAHFLSTTGDAWQNQLLSVVLNTAAFMQGDTTEEEAKQLAQEKRAEVSRRYYEFAGPFDEFIAVLVQDEVLSEPQGEDLLFVFEVYEAVDQYLPIVKLLYSYKSAREWEKAADLASVPLQ